MTMRRNKKLQQRKLMLSPLVLPASPVNTAVALPLLIPTTHLGGDATSGDGSGSGHVHMSATPSYAGPSTTRWGGGEGCLAFPFPEHNSNDASNKSNALAASHPLAGHRRRWREEQRLERRRNLAKARRQQPRLSLDEARQALMGSWHRNSGCLQSTPHRVLTLCGYASGSPASRDPYVNYLHEDDQSHDQQQRQQREREAALLVEIASERYAASLDIASAGAFPQGSVSCFTPPAQPPQLSAFVLSDLHRAACTSSPDSCCSSASLLAHSASANEAMKALVHGNGNEYYMTEEEEVVAREGFGCSPSCPPLSSVSSQPLTLTPAPAADSHSVWY